VSRILNLNLLGGFQASWSDQVPVLFSSKKAQALLAYLAVESGRPQPREVLASLLWGNTGEDRARHNLRQSLGKIRQAFGAVIVGDDDCLEIDAACCDTDIGKFALLANEDDSGMLRRCLDLYKGDLLDGLNLREPEFSDWLLVSRHRIRQSACEIAARLADRLISEDRPEEAITALNDLLVHFVSTSAAAMRWNENLALNPIPARNLCTRNSGRIRSLCQPYKTSMP
jgi:DNA-binding SARP family transcriptional activator